MLCSLSHIGHILNVSCFKLALAISAQSNSPPRNLILHYCVRFGMTCLLLINLADSVGRSFTEFGVNDDGAVMQRRWLTSLQGIK